MDLARHAAVLWRFRALTATGLVLGIVLAILASYQPTWDGGPVLTQRGSETWSIESSLLVTQPGFPEGRTTLPTTSVEGVPGIQTTPQPRSGQLEFADPTRFSALANLYAELAVSDRVRTRVPERPTAGQIEAHQVEATAGQPALPVIKLTTFAESAAAVRALNLHTVRALRGVLSSEQSKNEIPDRQRVELSMLRAPTAPVKTAGPSHTPSILAFLLCVLGAIAVTHLLAALRDRQQIESFDEVLFDDVMAPWSLGHDGELEPAERRPAAGRPSR
ncbi:MAG: hypothetical protein ACRDM7_21685 [Thermoleophilaceae bacterium]